jgi:phosphomannomutase
VEKTGWFEQVIRTRIGSPYVITAMNEALESSVGPVVGYEANGGFLTASSVLAGRGALEPLPTRDAAIVIVSILDAANRVGQPVSALLRELPARYTASDRLRDFDPDQSRRRLDALEEGGADAMTHAFGHVAGTLQSWSRIDGLRMTFASGDVVHLRPSGNAPELRCYTEAGSDEESRTLLAEVLRIADHWR